MDASADKGWRAVAALGATQHGCVTTEQLHGRGIGKGAIEKAVRSGRLHRIHRGVYAVGHALTGREGRWMAGVLAGGEGAVLSHRSLATATEIRRGEGRFPDVTVPPGGPHETPGITFHRSPLEPWERDTWRGIPCTTVGRLMVDLAHTLEPEDLHRAVREAQYLRRFDAAAVGRSLERWPSTALAAVLDDLAAVRTDVEIEFLALLDGHRVPRPQTQVVVLGHRVDFLWARERLVVETDGWGAHTSFDAFQRDRSQTNLLQLAGYLVLRFTVADVRRRPARTAALLNQALTRVAA